MVTKGYDDEIVYLPFNGDWNRRKVYTGEGKMKEISTSRVKFYTSWDITEGTENISGRIVGVPEETSMWTPGNNWVSYAQGRFSYMIQKGGRIIRHLYRTSDDLNPYANSETDLLRPFVRVTPAPNRSLGEMLVTYLNGNR